MNTDNRKSNKLLSAMGGISDDLVLSAAQEKEIILRTRKPRWAAVLVTAVLALIFAVGAAAAGGHIPVLSDLFAPAFYYGEEGGGPDIELLEKVGQPIGVSVEEQGVTVTVRSILRDRHTLTLVLSVQKQGIEREEFLFDWNRLVINDSRVLEGGSGGIGYGVRGDDTIDYTITWREQEPIPDGKMELILENLTVKPYAMFGLLGEKHINDTWNLEFEAYTEDLSWEIPAGQHTTMDGAEAVLDEIILSPLSLTVKYTAERELGFLEGYEHPDFTITLKDGTRLFNNLWYREKENPEEYGSGDTESISGAMLDSEPEGDHYRHFYTVNFSRLVPLEDVVSLVIEGQEIPLE
ncbi:MAG: DUF4179 domain-containing protein [Acutalibacter sp.]|nr:DUF4179 domain-containing protein [Acutalibacter sp.]